MTSTSRASFNSYLHVPNSSDSIPLLLSITLFTSLSSNPLPVATFLFFFFHRPLPEQYSLGSSHNDQYLLIRYISQTLFKRVISGQVSSWSRSDDLPPCLGREPLIRLASKYSFPTPPFLISTMMVSKVVICQGTSRRIKAPDPTSCC